MLRPTRSERKMAKAKGSVVIKKEEVVEGGHHGGAWKVAYADFVTAMMAFFLLMWLLNATTEQQRRGLADYFSPTHAISTSQSGFGLPFGGRTVNSDGSLASDRGAVQVTRPEPPIVSLDEEVEDPTDTPQHRPARMELGSAERTGDDARTPPRTPGPVVQPGDRTAAAQPAEAAPTPEQTRAIADQELKAELERRERAGFEQAAQQIRDAVRADPALAELAKQLRIDITPEGLRVQLVDEDRQPMFPTGSAVMNERARALLAKVAPVLARLPQGISIVGHTDSAPYRGGDRSNWDLSAERANTTRRLLVEAGIPEPRVRSVAGLADRDLLVPNDGMAASNRRIAITVLRDAR
jgi:chemotaxis protein MotB